LPAAERPIYIPTELAAAAWPLVTDLRHLRHSIVDRLDASHEVRADVVR